MAERKRKHFNPVKVLGFLAVSVVSGAAGGLAVIAFMMSTPVAPDGPTAPRCDDGFLLDEVSSAVRAALGRDDADIDLRDVRAKPNPVGLAVQCQAAVFVDGTVATTVSYEAVRTLGGSLETTVFIDDWPPQEDRDG